MAACGTITAYVHGCRCPRCKEAGRIYRAKWREDKRNGVERPARQTRPKNTDGPSRPDMDRSMIPEIDGATTLGDYRRNATAVLADVAELEHAIRARATELGYQLTRTVTADGATVTVTIGTPTGAVAFSAGLSREALTDAGTWLLGQVAV